MWIVVVIAYFDAITVHFARGVELNHEGSLRIADIRAEI